MAKGLLLPIPRLGITPAASSKLWCWAPGGTTKQTVYSDSDLTTPVSQPLQADSAGLFSAVYLDPAYGYKIAVYASSEVNDPPTGTPLYSQDNAYLPAAHIDPLVCQGRPTLTSGTPVTTTDVTAATSIYFTPYGGNAVALYDTTATAWRVHTFAEVSLALTGLAANLPYDLFLYDNAGTKTLESVAWSSDTARATALATQSGVLVKTGSANKRYVGTFRTTGTIGQSEDSFAKRYCWSYYNRAPRAMRVLETTGSWAYNVLTWRQANAAPGNQLDCVIGVAETSVIANVQGRYGNSSANRAGAVAIGLDSTTAPATGCLFADHVIQTANVIAGLTASLHTYPAIGRHTLAWLEIGDASSATGTFYGTSGFSVAIQTGISGWLHG